MKTKTTDPKKKSSAGRPKKPAGAGTKNHAQAAHPASPADLSQFGGIMTKSLDLAEASINLGLNLMQKFGTSLHGPLLNRVTDAGKNLFAARESVAQAQAAHPAPDDAAPQHDGGGHQFAGVSNRLPLFPGSTVHIPFSINNDAAGGAKTVKVHLEGFAGEITGTILAPDHFSITPKTKDIAPMDFEKFVVTGAVPVNCRSDAYLGTIVVIGDEDLRIPLKLVITSRT